jgi:hypothetical protein
MTSTESRAHAVNTSDMIDLCMIMSHSQSEPARDIGRLYMTLHKISIINRAREAKCNS